LGVRQSYSSEEAPEQTEVALKAEGVELTEGNTFNRRLAVTQSMDSLTSSLERLGKVAKQNKLLQFNNLMHHLTPALLFESFNKLNKHAAKGVYGQGGRIMQKTVSIA
jgi:energy-coupling factor transporter transmembrane protein EcfT